jgi:Transcriptional regulator, AbiEi antitoxin
VDDARRESSGSGIVWTVRTPPAVAGEQFGTFTTAQAVAAGWTSHALRHAVGAGILVRLRPGAYAIPHQSAGRRYADHAALLAQQAAAATLTNRRVPASHSAAAALLGLPLVSTPARACMTVPPRWRGDIAGVHLHEARLHPGHVTRLGRIHLTSPERTIIDLAREGGAAEAIAAADRALALGLTTSGRLAGALVQLGGWPGLRAARQVVRLSDSRSESALESMSRLRMDDAGLAVPDLQARLVSRTNEFLGRVDFYWDEFGVVGEADGLEKYDESIPSLREEKLRQERLEQAGLIVVRWGWEERNAFDPVASRLRAAFARAKRPDRAAREWCAPASSRAAS